MKTLLLSVLFLSCGLIITISDLRINTTSSIPLGIYRLTRNTEFSKENIILFCLSGKYAYIARDRKYLSGGKCLNSLSPIGKHVIATENDKVKINSKGIFVNGFLIEGTAPLKMDMHGRELKYAQIDRILLKDEYIVASSKENSFDSRYYGVIKGKDILGSLRKVFVI